MKTIEKILPAGFRFRELWLPEAQNNSATLPSAVAGGQKLTYTGARNGTTADGVHFTGAATSNAVVAAAAGQNAKAAFHITIRFKLDQTFASGAAAIVYLFRKVTGNEFLYILLDNSNGQLVWRQGDGVGGNQFTLTSTTVSWTAGTWYTVTASLTDTPTQRLIVNGAVEDTDTAAAVATPNGGDMVFMSSVDGGTDGAVGVVSLICVGVGATATVALTTAEETDLYKGIPPASAKVQYLFTCDEGVGTTLTDRGSAAGNATLDSACTWDFGKCKQACISCDGINDIVSSASGVGIGGALSVVWAGKIKSTYSSLAAGKVLLALVIDGDNKITFEYQTGLNNVLCFASALASGVTSNIGTFTIDDYAVMMATVSGGTVTTFLNGASVASVGGLPTMPATAATFNLGAYPAPTLIDVSKPIAAGLVEGAMSATQVKQFSRTLDQMFNLGIGV